MDAKDQVLAIARDMRRKREMVEMLAEELSHEVAAKALAGLGKKRKDRDAESRPPDLPPLTPEIGEASGVGAYPLTEIIEAYRVSRATAYRWKKANAKPSASVIHRKDGKRVRHITDDGPAKPRRVRDPYHPSIRAVKHLRSVFHWVRNEIERTSGRWGVHNRAFEEFDKLEEEMHEYISKLESDYGYGFFGDDDDDWSPDLTKGL